MQWLLYFCIHVIATQNHHLDRLNRTIVLAHYCVWDQNALEIGVCRTCRAYCATKAAARAANAEHIPTYTHEQQDIRTAREATAYERNKNIKDYDILFATSDTFHTLCLIAASFSWVSNQNKTNENKNNVLSVIYNGSMNIRESEPVCLKHTGCAYTSKFCSDLVFGTFYVSADRFSSMISRIESKMLLFMFWRSHERQ